MKNELDSKMVLTVFEKVRQHGTQHEDGYLLEGVQAMTDFDGYTLFLKDPLVTLSFGFHNQYHFDYQQAEQLERFIRKLEHIHTHY